VNINKKTILGIACAITALICAVYVGKIVIQSIIHHEVTQTKKEVVKKIKTIDIDEEKAAESVAKTIHGVRSFKEKIKDKLNKLDSLDKKDTAKGVP